LGVVSDVLTRRRVQHNGGREDVGIDAAIADPVPGVRSSFPTPGFDLWTEPHLATAPAQVDHRSRHLRIATLIEGNRVSLSEAEQLGDSVRVD
jgi:hypothetical protein